jgi:hypothetical protein
MPLVSCLIAALCLAVWLALRVRGLRKHPTRGCPACSGVGWLPKAGQGNWSCGGRPCRRCHRSGNVTVSVIWWARLITGQRPVHPRTRLVLMPEPTKTGRQAPADLEDVPW